MRDFMNIAVIGTGYVGLVQGVMLAEFGMHVTCMDVDEKKINNLKQGIVPIYEPGLKEFLDKNLKSGRISFTTDIEDTVKKANVIFIAVGTPPQDDGSADLRYVLAVANLIGKYINDYKVVVDKSTVPVGTGKLVKGVIEEKIKARGVDYIIDIVSNPEFLREGKAVQDCLQPDRVVLGVETDRSLVIMKKIYHALQVKQVPFMVTNIETAELIKYAANAFLAVKIAFINEISALAEKVGANTLDIAKGMGLDARIAPSFLRCGPGYGGSCFPKDTKAIADIARKNGEQLLIIEAAIEANKYQKQRMVNQVKNKLENLEGKIVAVLGLSFKPDTDDVRDAPSLDIIPGLIENGAIIRAFCPEGMVETKWRLSNYSQQISYCTDEYDAVTGSNAVVILTEWDQFNNLNLEKIKNLMKENFLFDFRNIFIDDKIVRELFNYIPVGLK